MISFGHVLIYLCISFINVLVDPTFMELKSGQGMAKVLLEIWKISRNITNIILAFMLVIGGIATVVVAEGNYIKTYATKFVLAVLLVNFSWFFPRVILDLSNVLTATIYSLPSQVKDYPCVGFKADGEKEACKIISEIQFFKKDPGSPWICPIPSGDGQKVPVCVKYENLNADANSPMAIMGGLIVNYARLQHLAKVVKGSSVGASPAAGDDAFSRVPGQLTFLLLQAMVTFFSIMLLFPLLAIMVVFFIRIPTIWATVAFMPFMFLGFVAGDKMSFWNPMEKIWKKFLHAAFVPAVVAIPFSIGFLMINVAMRADPSAGAAGKQLLDTFGIPLIGGTKDAWQLLWVGMAMIIIWKGVFDALNFDPDMQTFTAPFQNAGKSMGSFFMKLPLLMPLPIPGMTDTAGNKVRPSAMQVLKVIQNPMATLAPTGKLEGLDKIWERMSGGASGARSPAHVEKLTAHLRADVTNVNTFNSHINKINDARSTPAEIKTATDQLKNLVKAQLPGWAGNSKDLEHLLIEAKKKITGLSAITPNKAVD
jgi:hypothetical protein